MLYKNGNKKGKLLQKKKHCLLMKATKNQNIIWKLNLHVSTLGVLSQSEENKCMWTRSKDVTTWDKPKITSIQFLLHPLHSSLLPVPCPCGSYSKLSRAAIFTVCWHTFILLIEKDLPECRNGSVKLGVVFWFICAFHPESSWFFFFL